jgi:hypothetical protein
MSAAQRARSAILSGVPAPNKRTARAESPPPAPCVQANRYSERTTRVVAFVPGAEKRTKYTPAWSG